MNQILSLVSLLFLFSQQSFALAYECKGDFAESEIQLLAVIDSSNSSGMLLEHKNDYYQHVEGQMTVIRAMDGEAITIRLARKQEKVDWGQEADSCFVFGEPDYYLIIDEEQSKLFYMPIFIKNPNFKKNKCMLPRPLQKPIAMTCKLL
jgi:hypothetical protein